ncbi:hypothetical protein JTE90_019867 [Oedothorax gibbosus]|uniref:Uncharacterized protein n=1 Tax=Oedothorax gibbosus TaxID=931172 RepID=A0AAV6VZW2_9ARAC|nr:hypothetical protein JTE90_019867 [Oedothorax gibbosus]
MRRQSKYQGDREDTAGGPLLRVKVDILPFYARLTDHLSVARQDLLFLGHVSKRCILDIQTVAGFQTVTRCHWTFQEDHWGMSDGDSEVPYKLQKKEVMINYGGRRSRVVEVMTRDNLLFLGVIGPSTKEWVMEKGKSVNDGLGELASMHVANLAVVRTI